MREGAAAGGGGSGSLAAPLTFCQCVSLEKGDFPPLLSNALITPSSQSVVYCSLVTCAFKFLLAFIQFAIVTKFCAPQGSTSTRSRPPPICRSSWCGPSKTSPRGPPLSRWGFLFSFFSCFFYAQSTRQRVFFLSWPSFYFFVGSCKLAPDFLWFRNQQSPISPIPPDLKDGLQSANAIAVHGVRAVLIGWCGGGGHNLKVCEFSK